MLIVPMYHRIFQHDLVKDQEKFLNHLQFLAQNFSFVLPGDNLSQRKISICLTFDDAYFDFYHLVFPLLKKHSIPAVLAVPTKLILPDDHGLTLEARLNAKDSNSYCAWSEIKEMHASGLVVIASHSDSHANLADSNVDLQQEIVTSKTILADKLKSQVDTFVYPYGNFSSQAHEMVCSNYKYAMRIGSSVNFSWHNWHGFTYRIDAEHYWPQQKWWALSDYSKYLLKYLSNSIRGK